MHPDRLTGLLMCQPKIHRHQITCHNGMLKSGRQRSLVKRMNPIQDSTRIGHRLVMRHAANSPDRRTAKRNGLPPIPGQVKLIDRHRHIGRDFTQPGIGVFQMGDILPNTCEYGCPIGGQVGFRPNLAPNPAQAAVRHHHAVVIAPTLAVGCRVQHPLHAALTVLKDDLSSGNTAIGQERVTVKTAYLHETITGKGVADLPLMHLALVHHPWHGVGNSQQSRLCGLDLRVHEFACSDVRSDSNKLRDHALVIAQGHHGSLHPVEGAIFGSIAYLTVPHLTRQNHSPQIREKRFGVNTCIDDAVVPTQQLRTLVATDFAKFVIRVGDASAQIGDADNTVLIQRKFLVGQVCQCCVEISLALFPVLHQHGHQLRQGLQTVLFQGGDVVIQGLDETIRRHAQGVNGTLTAGQLSAHAVIGVGQLHRTQLQAPGFEVQVAVTLFVGLTNLRQECTQTRQQAAQLRRDAFRAAKQRQFSQDTRELVRVSAEESFSLTGE